MVQKSKTPAANPDAVAPKRRGRPRAYQPEIALGKALDLFRKDGFAATSLDDLSAATGMNRPSLYGAFGDKRELYIKSYARYRADARAAMLEIFRDELPIRERLQEFYNAYTNVIFTRKWLRIYLYSGLKGLDINRWYVGVVRDKILSRIIRECRHEAGLPVQNKPTAAELEMAWVFHSGIFYYGVRKYIYESPVLEDKEQMISDALDAFLAGFERVFGTAVGVHHSPVKAVV